MVYNVFVFESGMYCICIGKAGHTGPDCDRWCHQGAAQWLAALHHLPLIRKHRYTQIQKYKQYEYKMLVPTEDIAVLDGINHPSFL